MRSISATRRIKLHIVMGTLVLLAGASTGEAVPVTHPGDFLLPTYGGRVILYHPETGMQEDFAQLGPSFTYPSAIVREASGDFLVADFQGAILRVAAATGDVTVLSQDGDLIQVFDITLGPDGSIYEADGASWILRIDPVTGAQTMVSSQRKLFACSGIEYGPDGGLYVTNIPAGAIGLVRVDPVSGDQSVVSDLGFFFNPWDLAFRPDGSLWVANREFVDGELLGVDLPSGVQTKLAEHLPLLPLKIFPLAPDRVLVAGSNDEFSPTQGFVLEVNPTTGTFSTLLTLPVGIRSLYVFPGEAPVPTHPITWGSIKDRYR